MFRCQICERVAPAGTKAERITVARRSKTYAVRSRPVARRRGRRGSSARKIIDKGGEGHEIVQEVIACEDCAADYKAKQAAIRAEREVAPEVVDEETIVEEAAAGLAAGGDTAAI
ncbi:MAG: hypothetical protein D6725_13800 [Planctomycetota bacterium]|nr:MAG: hypothetical protein D6725_13800 [Planctomycetota bacterium]